ncbi:MAG: transcriptional repressor [Chloroflexi bacterium]|nr:MAG: transcriptional repressor [Chloroflexota bacterium]RLC96361.1 MAG: transcriptional repressor [Chloroflexota bacterium]
MSCTTVLKEKGYRMTLQRSMILDILHEAEGHITAEDILSRVKSKAPEVNKSTVYRNLELLEELGVVVKSEHDGRFIYHHAQEGGHHHLVCRRCGKIIECDRDVLAPLEKTLIQKFDFEADLRHIVIHGICGACRRKQG